MKKILLAVLCVGMALVVAGCATVNSENSFQDLSPAGAIAPTAIPGQTQATQQPATAPTAAPAAEPTATPASGGFNG